MIAWGGEGIESLGAGDMTDPDAILLFKIVLECMQFSLYPFLSEMGLSLF